MKYIDIREFVEFGYLQELNRVFLHPLGLALEVIENDDGSVYISGVQDHRDDPDGFRFAEGHTSTEKTMNVNHEFCRRVKAGLVK